MSFQRLVGDADLPRNSQAIVAPGGQVTVYGSGFPSNVSCGALTLSIGGQPVADPVPDAQGNFQAEFTATQTGGDYRVEAQQICGQTTRYDAEAFGVRSAEADTSEAFVLFLPAVRR